MPLRPALEFQQEYQVRGPVSRADAPDHVGVVPSQVLVDLFGGQRFEGPVVDPVSPLGDMSADEESNHPRVGEELLECGVVHRTRPALAVMT